MPQKSEEAHSPFLPRPLCRAPALSLGFLYGDLWCCIWVPHTHCPEKSERFTRTSQISSQPRLTQHFSPNVLRVLKGPVFRVLTFFHTPHPPRPALGLFVHACSVLYVLFPLLCSDPTSPFSSFRPAARCGSFSEAFCACFPR